MALYLVHCHVPGKALNELAAMQRAIMETSQRFSAEGKPVHLVHSTFVPGEAHVMCLFEAANAALVRDVNEVARVPFMRVVEALDLTPKLGGGCFMSPVSV